MVGGTTMRLRDAENYLIGLDMGTGSVGWAVTDTEGNLMHFNGQPTWGSRIFPTASTAAEARSHRGQRRRYERRRQRIVLLQGFFKDEMDKVDPDFFLRLNQSMLLLEDRDDRISSDVYALFNDPGFTDKEYYDRYPTIYHLRKRLIEDPSKADIRFVYLALHNIVKHRGNFLHQDNKKLSASNSDMVGSVEEFLNAFVDWCDNKDISTSLSGDADALDETAQKITAILEDPHISRGDKYKQFSDLLNTEKAYKKSIADQLGKAAIGYKVDFKKFFSIEGETDYSFMLSEDEKVEEFMPACPDDGQYLFEMLQKVYSAYILSGILEGAKEGETISFIKARDFDTYGKQLKTLKRLVRTYAPDAYDSFFRGKTISDDKGNSNHSYQKRGSAGYTLYDLDHGSGSYDRFKKDVVDLFEGENSKADPAVLSDPDYLQMKEGFEHERFLRRQKTSDNGAIPYQFHLEELRKICENQGKYYPFLLTEEDKLTSLVEFRIPYYVGPLTTKNATKDAQGKNRFAWSARQEGKENQKIYPWNWQEVIDKSKSAERFIGRMTGECSYLLGEPVLPRNSLLYEEFCVRNELNGITYSVDGDDWRHLTVRDSQKIFNELFCHRRSVSYKAISDWFKRNGLPHVHVRGGQGETGLESKLSAYRFFTEKVFGTSDLRPENYPMLEEVILWSTIFEDRDILRDKLKEKYGQENRGPFNAKQIKTICKHRFSGWGRLSRKLLTGFKADTDQGKKSIMDILRNGNPNSDERYQPMVFMQILHDDRLGFQKMVDSYNLAKMQGMPHNSIDNLQGSPANRRAINQALRIVDEITRIAKHEPTCIYLENTRDDGPKKRTINRYRQLKAALEDLREQGKEQGVDETLNKLKRYEKVNMDERLMLYFLQNGKSLYSGTKLEIKQLSEYQVDHIIPQTAIKDDSLDNKALVLASENQSKSDSMLLDKSIRRRMCSTWTALHDAKLLSDKKYNNLMRSRFSDNQLGGFVARQLVETSQIVKMTSMLLEERYPDTKIYGIKARISHELRKIYNLPKHREVNNYHHAQDALLALTVGRFISSRYPDIFEHPVYYAHVVRLALKQEAQSVNSKRNVPGSVSFIVSSFQKPSIDDETGEVLRDGGVWQPNAEMKKVSWAFDLKQCHITHMPEITSGAFWDATIYSPKTAKKKPTLPIKQGLDPTKYGGFSSEYYAYFFTFSCEDNKGRSVIRFGNVPVSIASEIDSENHDLSSLITYARGLAAKENLKFLHIIRPRIYKYQLIEVAGNRFYVTGKKEVRNATEVALSLRDARLYDSIQHEDNENDDSEAYRTLLHSIENSLLQRSPRLAGLLDLGKWDGKFNELGPSEKLSILSGIMSEASAQSNSTDLRPVGKGPYTARIGFNFSKEMSDSSFRFVDQSVTGMFETKAKIEL